MAGWHPGCLSTSMSETKNHDGVLAAERQEADASVGSHSNTRGTLGTWSTPAELRVERVAGVTRVLVDALIVAQFPDEDRGARNLAIVHLSEGGSFTAAAIAAAFGLTESRVSQLRKRFREGGAAHLYAQGGAPRGQRTLSAKEVERVRALRRQGLTIDEIVRCINAKRVRASRATIGRLVRGIEPRRTGDLPFGDISRGGESIAVVQANDAVQEERHNDIAIRADGDDEGAGAEEAAARCVDASGNGEAVPSAPTSETPFEERPRACSVAGAMVAHAAFEALGLREALAASGARLRPARTFDLLRIAGVLLFGILLRYRSVESLRMLLRRDFGGLLGIDRAPEIRTVRRKLAELADSETGFDGTRFVRALAAALLRESAAPQGVYFFDDHFARYHGKQPFGKGHDAKSRLAVPGREDVYVHDLNGRAILFVPLPAPTSLSRALPTALAELGAIGAVPRLAVFDRGGWSKDLFRALLRPGDGSERIDFLTYLTARYKPRELPLNRFQVVEVEDHGRRHSYEIAERPLTLSGVAEPLRVIVLRDPKKDRQIPIVTSDPDLPAGRAVHLLRARWRQENSFKYLVGELAIDALIARDVELTRSDRVVQNPERKEIKAELAEACRELARCEKALSDALAANEEARRPTVRGFKIANSELFRLHQEAEVRVRVLEEDLAGTPAKVPLTEIDPTAQRATERTQRRLFVNGLKLLVHNAEKWLADRMGPGPYGQHALPIIRALTNQPGTIRRERDRLVVEIQPLDTPRYQRHVDQLLQILNDQGATFLDSGLRLEFRSLPPGSPAPCHVL